MNMNLYLFEAVKKIWTVLFVFHIWFIVDVSIYTVFIFILILLDLLTLFSFWECSFKLHVCVLALVSDFWWWIITFICNMNYFPFWGLLYGYLSMNFCAHFQNLESSNIHRNYLEQFRIFYISTALKEIIGK